MSRYMDLTVSGEADAVSERCLRALRSIGKVDAFDAATQIEGVIRVDREPADIVIQWKTGADGRVRLDIKADSSDELSRAADGALYRFIRAYKAVGWPDPVRQAREKRRRILMRAGIALAVVAVVLAIVALFYNGG